MAAAKNLRFCDTSCCGTRRRCFLTALIYDGVFERFPRCAAA